MNRATHCPLGASQSGSQALWVKCLRLDEMATFQKESSPPEWTVATSPLLCWHFPHPIVLDRRQGRWLPGTLQSPAGLPVESSTAAPSGTPSLLESLRLCGCPWHLQGEPADLLCSLPLQQSGGTLAGSSVIAGLSGLSREPRTELSTLEPLCPPPSIPSVSC